MLPTDGAQGAQVEERTMSWQPEPNWPDPMQGVQQSGGAAGGTGRYAQPSPAPYGQQAPAQSGPYGQPAAYGQAAPAGQVPNPFGQPPQAGAGYGQPAPYAPVGTFGQQAYGTAAAVDGTYGAPGYAGPGYAAAPWQTTRVVNHRPWSTILVWLNSLSTGVSALLLVAGIAFLFVGDPGGVLGTTGGIDQQLIAGFVGPFLLIVGAIAFAVSLTMLVMTVVGRRRADQGNPGLLQAAGWVAAVLSAVSLVGAVISLVSGDGFSGGIGSVLLLLVGVKVIGATRG